MPPASPIGEKQERRRLASDRPVAGVGDDADDLTASSSAAAVRVVMRRPTARSPGKYLRANASLTMTGHRIVGSDVARLELAAVQHPRPHRAEELRRHGEAIRLRRPPPGQLDVVAPRPAPEERPARQAGALDARQRRDPLEQLTADLTRLSPARADRAPRSTAASIARVRSRDRPRAADRTIAAAAPRRTGSSG